MAGKVLGVILLAFLSILLLSNIITALSTFFLAKDLDLLVAAPVGGVRLYLAKLAETVVHSSWMVALLALPIFTAYGIVYKRRVPVSLRGAGGLHSVSDPARRRGHGAHAGPGERLSRPAYPRAAGSDRYRRGRDRAGEPALPAPRAAGAAGRVQKPGGLPGGAPHADQRVPAQRMDRFHGDELAAPRGGPMAGGQALGGGRSGGGPGGRCSTDGSIPWASPRRRKGPSARFGGRSADPCPGCSAPCRPRDANSFSRTCVCSSGTTPSGASSFSWPCS